MLELNEILEIINKVENSNLEEFKLEHGTLKMTMKKAKTGEVREIKQISAPPSLELVKPKEETKIEPKPQKVEEEKVDKSSLIPVTAPMVGTFYESPDPESDAFVKVGDKVSKDTTVCILEAMKLFNEIAAETSGEIVEVLVENGQLVEYGQILFYIKPGVQ